MRVFPFLAPLALAFVFAGPANAGCVLVRTVTTTPGCYGYVENSGGAKVGWLRYNGTWVRSGSAAACKLGGYSSRQIGPDAVRLDDGTRIRLDKTCSNPQVF